jgi:ubiquinone/menaquinone biosynthesis C-methylase UbiE
MSSDERELRRRYEEIALSGDDTTTACDFHLRDLEIAFAEEFIRERDVLLDVGCGPGVALRAYGESRAITGYGIDYAENMVGLARRRLEECVPELDLHVQQASVTALPFPDGKFDVVTSHRGLMALLDWKRQQQALLEIRRVLKPGGLLILREGTLDGVARLNRWRRAFGLSEIDPSGRDRLYTRKLVEEELLEFIAPHYELLRTQRFGMYYFLTRIVQPLLVAPDPPRYDHPLNAVAREIAGKFPDLDGMGHLVGFALRKRP